MEVISVDVTHPPLHPDIAILAVKGTLYAKTLPQVEAALQTEIARQKKELIVNLAETSYISSGGWSMLLACLKKAREVGGDLLLAEMRLEVRDTFEMMEFQNLLRIFPTVESALQEGFGKTIRSMSSGRS